jgi:hypothetical protein
LCVCVCVCVCVFVCVWRTAGGVAPGEPANARMDEDIPTAAGQPYVDPLLEMLREDMRRLLGQLEGQKVKLTEVAAAWKNWKQGIGPDAVFDIKKYQSTSRSNRKKLTELLMCIPDTVNIEKAPANARTTAVMVAWAVLI